MRLRGMIAAAAALVMLIGLLPSAVLPAGAARSLEPLTTSASAAEDVTPLCATDLVTARAEAELRSLPFRQVGQGELQTMRPPGAGGFTPLDALDQTTQFWADNLDRGGKYQVTATLKRITPHGYIYVDNARPVADAALDTLAASWEGIYEKTTGLFGEPPDVDGDPHITILLLDILDGFTGKGGYVAGYFSPTNELPARFSNLREMFYMDTNPGRAGNNTWLQTLAHEFHHMINYNYHKAAGGQETWLNEGLAEFSGFNAGYGHTVNVVPFLSDPSNSLLEWSSQPRNYGASALFILYLWEHYGGDPLIRAITQNPALSVDAVDVALAAQGSSDRFRQIFDKWTVANYLGDPVSAGGVYGYKSLRFTDDLTPGDVADNKTVFRRPAPTSSFNTYPVSGNGAVNAWAARYYRFTGNAATLTFTFGGIGTARFGVNVVASSSDGFAAGTNAVSRMSLLDGAGGTLTVNGLGSAVRTVLLIPSGQPDDDGPAASAGYQFSGSVTGAAASSPTVTATPSVTASPSPSPSVTPQPSGTPIATPTLAPMPSPTPAPASLTAPADGAVLAGLGAQLNWTLPAGTTQYQLQVTPANNDGPAINLIRSPESGYSIPAPQLGRGDYLMLPGMTYTWRVRASAKAGFAAEGDPSWGPWTVRTFRTPAPNAASLTLVNPPDGPETGMESVTLQWRDASAALFYYEVQLSPDPQFRADPATAVAPVYWNIVHGGVTAPLNSWASPSLTPGATYYWRVRPRVQGDGAQVPWSASRRFVTAPVASAVNAISPITFGAALANPLGCALSGPLAAFPAGAPQAAVRFDAAGQGGVTVRWSLKGVLLQVDDRSVPSPGGCLTAALASPGGLPAGQYQVEVLAAGKLLGSATFTVG